MKFLRRKVRGTETVMHEGRVVHREIEVTVEREMVLLPHTSRASGQGDMHRCPCCGQAIPALQPVCLTHGANELTLGLADGVGKVEAGTAPFVLEEPAVEPNARGDL